MTFYTVHAKQDDKPEDVIFIKEGFNWYCFFFGIFWAAYKRVWSLTTIFLLIATSTLIIAKLGILSVVTIEVIRFIISIGLSFYANDFHRDSLKMKNYEMVDVVYSNDIKQALLRFLDKCKNGENKMSTGNTAKINS